MLRKSAVLPLLALTAIVGGCGVVLTRGSQVLPGPGMGTPTAQTPAPSPSKPAEPQLKWGVVVVAKDGLVWLPVDDTAGAQRMIESGPSPGEGLSAAISPDHRKVALFNQRGELRIFDLQTGRATVVTIVGEGDRQFVGSHPWARSSEQLAFVKDGNLYVAELDGTSRRITRTGDATSFAWAPGGGQIAFGRRDKKDHDVGLWLVTFGPPREAPKLSMLAPPNTENAVFAASAPTYGAQEGLAYLRSWEGGGLCFAGGKTPQVDVDSAWFPLYWLPGDSAVVYNSFNPETGSEGLKRCAQGGKPEPLVSQPVLSFDVHEDQILVAVNKTPAGATEPLGSFDLMVIGPDGQQRLKGWSATLQGSDAECRWCPDGSRVAVLAQGLDHKSDPASDLLVGAPGGELKPLGSGAQWLVGWAAVPES